MLVTVVIPAYNEEEHLRACLESLASQRTRHAIDVIVVDNGSTDATADIARSYADRLSLTILHEPVKGRGRARRTGWHAARGRIIFSTDADTVLPPHWIETLSTALIESDAVAVTSPSRIRDCDPMTNTLQNLLQPVCILLFRAWTGYAWLGGYSFATWKWAYRLSGGFSADADAQDDIDITMRLRRYGRIITLFRTPVAMSGRRFKHGLIRGFLEYVRTFIERFWLKRRLVPLTDIR